MANFQTQHLGLALTHSSEANMTFLEWRTLINGVGNNSNMILIDAAIETLSEQTGRIADGIHFNPDTGLLQLTQNGTPIEGASTTISFKGYTKFEVDALLKSLSDTIDDLRQEIDDIEAGAFLTNFDEVKF